MNKIITSMGFMALLLFLFIRPTFTSVSAQQVSPELKRKINDIYVTMERYKRTTPAWKQYVDAGMSGGNYYMSIGEWSNAIKCFNKVLKITPNYYEAIVSRNYCRQQLKLSRKHK